MPVQTLLGEGLEDEDAFQKGLDTEGVTKPGPGAGTDPQDPVIRSPLGGHTGDIGPGGKRPKFGQRFVWEGKVEEDFQKFFQENVGSALEPYKRTRTLVEGGAGLFGQGRGPERETEDFYEISTGQAREVERSLREQFTEQRTRQLEETTRQRQRSRAAQPGIAARRRAEQQQLVTGGGGSGGAGGSLLTSPFGLLESPRLRQQTLLGGAR